MGIQLIYKKMVIMSVKKLKKIESLLFDVIIFCTDEAKCEPEVIEELHSLKERVYKLQRRIPQNGQNEQPLQKKTD